MTFLESGAMGYWTRFEKQGVPRCEGTVAPRHGILFSPDGREGARPPFVRVFVLRIPESLRPFLDGLWPHLGVRQGRLGDRPSQRDLCAYQLNPTGP